MNSTLLGLRAALALVLLVVGALFAGAAPAHAQPAGDVAPSARCPEGHPSYHFLRQREHWGHLSDPSCQTDYADPLKYIPVGRASFAYLGGESRSLAEAIANRGAGPASGDAYLLQRLTLHAGLQTSGRSDGGTGGTGLSGRLFAELKSGLTPGLDQVGPADRDRLDLGQALAEVAYAWGGSGSEGEASPDEPSRLMLRAGRFELDYGSGRMISVREGPNVRASFDGALARLTLGEGGLPGTGLLGLLAGWTTDVFATRPNTTRPGVFDDARTDGAALWGVYAGGPLGGGGHTLDVYYLGFERESARYAQGTLDQRRHSFGARWVYRSPGGDSGSPWTHDLEAVVQSGVAKASGVPRGTGGETGDVLAWRVTSEWAYAFGALPASPALGLALDVSSGDRGPADADQQTFTAPYPPGRFYDRAVPFGPSNLTDLRPTLTLRPLPWLDLTAGAHLFWRTRASDGVYAVPGFVVRAATEERGAEERFIGWVPGAILAATASAHLTVGAEVNQFRPGGYYAQSGTSATVNYLGFEVTYKF